MEGVYTFTTMKGQETPIGRGTQEEGRKEIPLEVALNAQTKILELMTPLAVKPYLTEKEDDPVRAALWERWMEKYMLVFNGFTEFCNEHSTDREFITRAQQGKFSQRDYDDMITFFEHKDHGEPFFRDYEEIAEFLKPFVH